MGATIGIEKLHTLLYILFYSFIFFRIIDDKQIKKSVLEFELLLKSQRHENMSRRFICTLFDSGMFNGVHDDEGNMDYLLINLSNSLLADYYRK